MFHLSDYAVAARDLAILESGAMIDSDGHITFKGEKFEGRGAETFNACDIYLQWGCGQFYGVQRVRVGKREPQTAATWRKLLTGRAKGQVFDRLTLYVVDRALKVEAVFPDDVVEFEVLGWRLTNAVFWTPGKAIKIPEAKEARVRFIADETTINAAAHIPASLAKAAHGKSKKENS